MNEFSSFSSITPESKHNQNMILSRFPIVSKGEIDFSGLRKSPLEKTIWADVRIGEKKLRIYNCHFGIVKSGPKTRATQLELVLEHAQEHSGPVIICGDMNTTIPPTGIARKFIQLFHLESNPDLLINGKAFIEDERYIFIKVAERYGFRETTDISRATWRAYPFLWEPWGLKLDWFLVKDVKTPKVTLAPYVSDHRAILASCSIRT